MLLAIAIAALVVSLVVGVVALALSTGDGAGSDGARRGRRRRVGAITAVTVFFGLGIPALVVGVEALQGDRRAVGGVELTAAQAHGRELFARSCRNCHTLAAANTVGLTGPSLDERLGPIASRADRVALVEDAIARGRARGQGQMPIGLLKGQDAADVADFLAAAAGRGDERG